MGTSNFDKMTSMKLPLKCLSVGLLWLMAAPHSSSQSITDRQLFRESFAEAKTAATEYQSYIFGEIAEAETARGYYTDASEAARLVQQHRDVNFSELVKARLNRGDMLGAKQLAVTAEDRRTQWLAEQSIAFWQISSGDLNGARETVEHLPSRFQQDVLQSIGVAQVEKGELEAALRTVSKMQGGWSDDVYYALAIAFRKRGNQQKAHELAGRIRDKELRRAAEHLANASGRRMYDTKRSTDSPTVKPNDDCELAVQRANQGQYEEAYTFLQTKQCDCSFVVSVYADSRDVVGAESALRKCSPNPSDVSDAMAALSEKCAELGDIPAALRFADAVHVPGAYDDGEGYLAPALRQIAHAWAKKDGADAPLKWARSRPPGYERAMALLGIAESVPPQ